jgi:hypothetical protein
MRRTSPAITWFVTRTASATSMRRAVSRASRTWALSNPNSRAESRAPTVMATTSSASEEPRRIGITVQAVLADLVEQRAGTELEQLCGARLVAAGPLQRRRMRRRSRAPCFFTDSSSSPSSAVIGGAPGPDVSAGRHVSVGRRHRTMARSMVFSSSRTLPGHVLEQQAHGVGSMPLMSRRSLRLYSVDEVAHEQRDLVAPLAQRHEVDGHDGDAIVEVAPEPVAGADLLLEVLVGRGDERASTCGCACRRGGGSRSPAARAAA